MTNDPIIQVEHLTKVYRNYDRREGIRGAMLDLFHRRYRQLRAVDDVSFTIGRGEVVGYIGANGAGKSTTIKMLTGILTPTGGTMTVNGLVPQKDRYAHARQIGVVFGQRTQLWWDLAVIEAFHLLQKIYEVPQAQYRQRLDRFIEVLDIKEQLHLPVRHLSLGQRMKCDLCASLLHSPPLLFLDEPTIGLDVAVKERIRRFIRTINREEQCTIILTTHDLNDIEQLCPRIIIIDNGKILYDGSQDEIKDRFGRARRVVLQFKQEYPPLYIDRQLPAAELPIAFSGGQGDAGAPNPLDEPGARQFMAELGAVMNGGEPLRVRRLNLKQYQVSFDRTKYTAGEVIRRLLESYAVDDLELREAELSDIVRAIYEGRHSFGPERVPGDRPAFGAPPRKRGGGARGRF